MRVTLITFSIFISTILCGQTLPIDTVKLNSETKIEEFPTNISWIKLDTFTIDTIHLQSFRAKKIVSYELGAVTFHVDYKEFTKMLKATWEIYKEGQKNSPEELREMQSIRDSGYKQMLRDNKRRWEVLNYTYQYLRNNRKSSDTVHLSHKTFSEVGFGTWNNFFPHLIDENKCAITNKKGELQFIIIRQKGSWYRGHLSAWGGRLYFFVGQENYFIEGTDWIS